MTEVTYRPHIDDLRAIAVLAVILYHVDARLIPGGFLGVDIFFVISGYLITSLIATDLARGRFTLLRFYERRVRRILPVLFVVLAATIPFAAHYLLPFQQNDFAKSLLATVLFSSNILFWQETGYFMAEADLKPLLHTWSLAVEEQFYLLYPLLVAALWRARPRTRIVVLDLVFEASLGASQILAQKAPGANFYLLPTRAWELMAGALLALAHVPDRGGMAARNMLACLGILMIAAALALFDGSTPMPSLWGLVPVAGTVLVIGFATRGTLPGRILSLRPVVLVGLVSFSAYLWHWPILVFARIAYGDALSPVMLAALVALTYALSLVSWALVERPFRRRGTDAVIATRPLVLSLLVFAFGLATLTNLPGMRIVGGPGLLTEATDPTTPEGIEAKIAINYGLGESCEGAFTLAPECRTSDTPEVMPWGDSFAMHLAPAIDAGVGARGMIQHTKSVCVPIVDISVVTPEYPADWSEGCIAFNDQVLEWLSTQPSVRYVVISSPFGLIYNDIYMRGGEVVPAPRTDIVREKLLETAARVRAMGKTLVIVSPPPVTGENIGQCLATVALQGGSHQACDFTTDHIHDLSKSVHAFLKDIADEIPVVFLDDLICADGICDTRIGDIFVFRDTGHLSIEASRYLGEQRALYHRIEVQQ